MISVGLSAVPRGRRDAHRTRPRQCDSNGTVYSMIHDIFTLARDHGAQAALLYSLTSQVRPDREKHPPFGRR